MERFVCKLLLCSFLILSVLSCRNEKEASDLHPSSRNIYARGFVVTEGNGFITADIRNPWDTTKILQRYILVAKDSLLPDNLPSGTLLRTPLKRVAVYAALHCGIIRELGCLDYVVGICDTHFVGDTVIQNRIKSGAIADMGDSFMPDVERIMELQPEAILLSPYKDSSSGKVSQLGIPVIEIADYMESVPLARAEWLKFFALLFDKEAVADSLFSVTEKRYKTLVQMGRRSKIRPKLFSELKTGGVWYQPGGNSYMAALYRDAGADYLWSDTKEQGSIALSFEEVLERASDADIWIFKYGADKDMTLSSLKNSYAPYAGFKAYKESNVWWCNTLDASYYEELPVHPDRALRDLLFIVHPELFTAGDTTRYFKRLEK